MSERVTMPALGESVTEGTVTRWLKNLGDTVEVDEPLLEVSTDKVDTEIPSPVAGTLQEILAQEDETVAVGADLAVVGEGAAPGSSDSDSGSGEQDGSDTEQDEPQDDGQPEAQGDSAAAGTAAPDSAQDDSTSDSDGSDDTGDSDDGHDSDDTGDTGSARADAGESGSDDVGSDAGSDSAGSGDEGSDSSGTTVTMPALGESVTEGTVTRWLKAEGDQVEVDEPLLEVSTDKVDTEIPSPVAGKLTKILVGEDETVPVGGDLAVVGGSGSSGAAKPASTQPDSAESTTTSAPAGSATASTSSAPDDSAGGSESDTEPAAERDDSSASEERHQERSSQPDGSGQAPPPPSREPSDRSGNGAAGTAAAGATSGSGSGSTSGSGGAADASAYVTPLVRKLAAQHDVDLSSLNGTGVGGRIRKQDVLDAADAAAQAAQAASSAAPEREPAQPVATSAPASGGSQAAFAALSAKRGTTEKMSRLRSLIARRMVESLQVSAQLTTVVEVDVTKVARLRARSKADFEAREGTKLSFLPFFALAAIEALKSHPNVNASVEGDTIVYHASENLGIAVDTEKGLIVPVIKDAGGLNIAGLARKIADLAERTRTNKVSPDELGGGTFTLTNTGSRGALFDTPIINQPQVAILGTGAVVKRPVVVTDIDGGETIAIRAMVYLALSYDHRIVDGADAAHFLNAMKVRLEEATFEV